MWDERSAVLLSRHQEVLEEYDRRITAADTRAGPAAPGVSPAPAAAAGAALAAGGQQAAPEQAQLQVDVLQAQCTAAVADLRLLPTLEAGFHGPEQKDTLASLWQFYSLNAFATLPLSPSRGWDSPRALLTA